MSDLLSNIEWPAQAVYNHTVREGGTKCGGTADIGQEQNGGVKCGGRVFTEEMHIPKYKLQGCCEVSVTTDPKGQPTKFWNWAINGMKSCISSIQFGADNNVPITNETLDDIQAQVDALSSAANQARNNEQNGDERDLEPERFWRWANFGLLSCLNFFRWAIETDVEITKEDLDKAKEQYIRLGQYIESLENTLNDDQAEIIRKGELQWYEEMSSNGQPT